jgi:hypothetical protein
MIAKRNRIYRKDGELIVEFTFAKDASLLEIEHAIASVIDSTDDSVTDSEKRIVRARLLDAIKAELNET